MCVQVSMHVWMMVCKCVCVCVRMYVRMEYITFLMCSLFTGARVNTEYKV